MARLGLNGLAWRRSLRESVPARRRTGSIDPWERARVAFAGGFVRGELDVEARASRRVPCGRSRRADRPSPPA
jgi:hypothetical protein